MGKKSSKNSGKPDKKFPFLVSWERANIWHRSIPFNYIAGWLALIALVLTLIFCISRLLPDTSFSNQNAALLQHVVELQQECVHLKDQACKEKIEAATNENYADILDMATQVINHSKDFFSQGVAEKVLGHHGKAVFWYQKAAELSHSRAQYNLGLAYQKGEGIRKDLNKAFYWIQKSAEQGELKAQYQLAYMYEKGHGVTADLKKASIWYEKAAKQGMKEAQVVLDEINQALK